MKTAAKAIYAAVASGVATLAGVMAPDASFSDVTTAQWVIVAAAVLGVGGGVYGIKNKES
jgi:hypothetical protein